MMDVNETYQYFLDTWSQEDYYDFYDYQEEQGLSNSNAYIQVIIYYITLYYFYLMITKF